MTIDFEITRNDIDITVEVEILNDGYDYRGFSGWYVNRVTPDYELSPDETESAIEQALDENEHRRFGL